MRLYLKDYPSHDPPTEITGVTFHTCSKMIGGGGVLSFTIRDFENANIATIDDYIWERVEVKTNNAATVLWEGYINNIVISRNSAQCSGIEGLRVLDKVWAHHTSIIAQGAVTTSGADSIDDTGREVAFPAAVNGKFCIFTDIVQPGVETAYPSAAAFYHNGGDDPADTETGVFGDLVPGAIGAMKIMDVTNHVANGYGIDVTITLPNGSTSTKLTIVLRLGFLAGMYYPGGYPEVHLYDDDAAAWITADNADTAGVGALDVTNWASPLRTRVYHNIDITDNLSDYINGAEEVKIRVVNGDPNAAVPQLAVSWVEVYWAKALNTYEAGFAAYDIIYTVDGFDADTLTFTGQTPNADGIATGDQYLVGDQLHTIMAAIFKAAELSEFTLDFDSTTEVDAADYYYSFVGPILRDFAERLGREYWQKIGWEIECKSATTDTAIDLTDANIKSWRYNISGDNMYKTVLVRGGNNEVLVYALPTYDSPYTLIRTESQLHTEQSAKALADQLATDHRTPQKYLNIIVDYDEADYTALDIGKGIDINLYSGVITKAQGVIRELHYGQNSGEHLQVEITID